jgi:hypothetical protein
MSQQSTPSTKPEPSKLRAPYQKPVLEQLRGWKMLTGAPISVPITDGIINFDVTHFGLDGN